MKKWSNKIIFFSLLIFLINISFANAFEVNASFRTQNNPPVLNPIWPITVYVNHIFIKTITATDPNLPQDSLTFIHNSSLSEFLIVQDPPVNPLITDGRIEFFTTNISRIGIYYSNISVLDIIGESDSEVIKLNISHNNSAPEIIDFQPNLSRVIMREGELQRFNITLFDFDLPNDVIRYEWYYDGFIIPGQIFDNFNYIADFNSAGLHNVSVYVYDQFNYYDSHIWNLTIIDVLASSGGGEGGGGGGGGASCRANWTCTEWSPCPVYRKQIRTCIDLEQCPRPKNKPPEQQDCLYIAPPTCNDGVRNGDEVLVDCGGSKCQACATCGDKLKNQEEEDVDCGGPCPRPCGLIYKPVFYPVCGDNKCDGIDTLMCPSDCKSSLPLITLFVVFFTLYIVYAYRKLAGILVIVNRKRNELDILSTKRLPTLSAFNNLLLIKKVLDKENKELLFKKYLNIMRNFFSVFFLVKYEFTYEELKKEIKSYQMDSLLRNRIFKLLDSLSKVEFKKEVISFSPFREVISDSLFIIESLRILEEKRYQEFRIKQRKERINLINFPKIIFNKSIKIANKLEITVKEANEYGKKMKVFDQQIVELNVKVKNRNFSSAKEDYKILKEKYNKLPLKFKNKYHKKLINIFNILNSVS